MTATIDALKASITIEDIRKATATMHGGRAKIPIDTDLQLYLTSVIMRMYTDDMETQRESTNLSHIFATLHTLLEVGIEAGRQLGLREAIAITEEVKKEAKAQRAAEENENGNSDQH